MIPPDACCPKCGSPLDILTSTLGTCQFADCKSSWMFLQDGTGRIYISAVSPSEFFSTGSTICFPISMSINDSCYPTTSWNLIPMTVR